MYLFIHWWTLSCFHALAVLSNKVMTVSVWLSFQHSIFVTFRYVIRNGTTGSTFNFSRTLRTVFHSSCASLQSYQECSRVAFPPHPQGLLFLVFLIMASLMGMRWYFVMVLICISLMNNDVERLLIYLLPICVSSFKECLFLCPFLNLIFCFFAVKLHELFMYFGY